MENIIIRRALTSEVKELQQISTLTFTETFAAINSAENMQQYLDTQLNTGKLAEELNNPDSSFWFAELEGNIIGYLKVNTGSAQTEQKLSNSLEIERIYILKAYHGKGVAQQLYQTAIDAARQMAASYVWLGVWEDNHRAIAFYNKLGFVPFDKHLFHLGDDAQTDILMKLELAYHQV